jgi:hypothetical protein
MIFKNRSKYIDHTPKCKLFRECVTFQTKLLLGIPLLLTECRTRTKPLVLARGGYGCNSYYFLSKYYLYSYIHGDILSEVTASVVYWSEFLATDPEVRV